MRKRIYLPVVALLAVCAAWSGLWAFTARSVGAAIDDWFHDEKAAGRLWACAERSLGGYPFRIEFRCAAPSFTTTIDGVTTTGRLGDLVAMANAYQPSLIVAKAQAPLQIQTGDNRMEVAWEDLRISHRMKEGALVLLAAEFDKPSLRMSRSGPAVEVSRSERFEVYARPAEKAGQIEAAVRAVRASVPTADELTGEGDPLDLVARATVSAAGLVEAAPLRRRLEAWRRAGGSLEVAEFRLAKAAARIEATGRFGLDAARRPQGRLDLQATNVEPVLKRLGVPTAAVALGSALSAMLPGARPPEPAGEPGGRALKLPLTVENGRISVGPVRTPFQVLPLY